MARTSLYRRSSRRYPARRRSYTTRRPIRRRRTLTTRRRRTTTRPRTQRIRGINYQGDRCIVKFRNVQQVNVKQTTGGSAIYIPGNVFVDTTIPGLTQYIQDYSFFRIMKATVSATFLNLEASASKDVGITLLPVSATALPTPTATMQWSEQPRTKSRFLTPLSGSRSLTRISMTGTTAMAYGNRTPTTSQQDRVPTGVPAGAPGVPGQPWFFGVWAQDSLDPDAEEAGTNIKIVTYYTVEFDQRNQQVV